MENELVMFEQETLAVVQQITALETQLKQVEEEEKKMRAELQAAMEKYNIKSWSNGSMTVTYKDAYERKGVDSNMLLVKYPEAYHECEKVTKVKPSITIKVK